MRQSLVTASKVLSSRPVRQLSWLVMLVAHAAALPSLWSVVASESGLASQTAAFARLVGMSLAAGFFILKIADVSWLRLKPGWRTGVAAVMVVALLHVGVLDRAVGGDCELAPGHLGLVLFVGTLWSAQRIVRFMHVPVPRALTGRWWRSPLLDLRLGRSLEPAFQPIRLFYVPSYIGARAPPAACVST